MQIGEVLVILSEWNCTYEKRKFEHDGITDDKDVYIFELGCKICAIEVSVDGQVRKGAIMRICSDFNIPPSVFGVY